jgi:hypothetical protein
MVTMDRVKNAPGDGHSGDQNVSLTALIIECNVAV